MEKNPKIMNLRNPSIPKSICCFKCGDVELHSVDKYTYLGILLNETLDFNVTAKVVARGALELLIAEGKAMGGMPYNVFSKLYYSLVVSIITNGAGIWSIKEYSVINKVKNSACRFFLLSVGKCNSNAAANGNMGWFPMSVFLWKVVIGRRSRLYNMNDTKINKHFYMG